MISIASKILKQANINLQLKNLYEVVEIVYAAYNSQPRISPELVCCKKFLGSITPEHHHTLNQR